MQEQFWTTINLPAGLHGQIGSRRGTKQDEAFYSGNLVPPKLPAAVQAMSKDVRAEWEMTGAEDAPTGDSCSDYLLSVLTCDYFSPVHPASLPPTQAEAAPGRIVHRGAPPHVPLRSVVAAQFKEDFEFSWHSKRAIVRTFASYRKQVLAGTTNPI